jgi:hypothetical protein
MLESGSSGQNDANYGRAPDVTVWQFGQRQLWARCSVTTTFGSGTSKTCLDWYPVPISGVILVRAALGIMVDDDIRIVDLTQGLSSMTFLPAWFLARRLPQALGPGRLRQPVT